MIMHFIISYHPYHYLSIHDILFRAHAYRIARKNHPLRVRGRKGGESGAPKQVAPKSEEQAPEELPE